jgi:hypothetical protein
MTGAPPPLHMHPLDPSRRCCGRTAGRSFIAGRGRVKSAEEIMNILEAYDLTGSLRDAGELAGCSRHTVARSVRAREEGRLVPGTAALRPGLN